MVAKKINREIERTINIMIMLNAVGAVKGIKNKNEKDKKRRSRSNDRDKDIR